MIGLVYGDLDPNTNLRAPTALFFFVITLTTSFSAALTKWQSAGLKVATSVGNLVGQLLFGWLADTFGRKRMCK